MYDAVYKHSADHYYLKRHHVRGEESLRVDGVAPNGQEAFGCNLMRVGVQDLVDKGIEAVVEEDDE